MISLSAFFPLNVNPLSRRVDAFVEPIITLVPAICTFTALAGIPAIDIKKVNANEAKNISTSNTLVVE